MRYPSQPGLDVVLDALDGSVVYEEGRGDLALAQRRADVQLNAARAQGDRRALAAAQLGRGIVHWLQGEAAAAQRCFEEIEPGAADPDWVLLAFVYRVLARQMRYLLYPSGAASSTLEIQTRWDQMGEGIENDQQWHKLAGLATVAATLDATFLYRILHNVPIARYVLAGSRDLDAAAEQARKLGVMLAPIVQVRQQAAADGVRPELLAGIDRLMADLCWHGRAKDDAQQLLIRAQKTYETAGDNAGLAACWMTFGDWMCAPLSSPLVWNHLMLEGDWNNSLSWVRERAEFDRSSINRVAAAEAYAEAERLFQAAGARRGVGVMSLRRAYLQVLAGNPAQASGDALQAEALFAETGDHLGIWLARTYQALAAIAAPARRADPAVAIAIGAWGKDDGSFSYATGLGIMLTRAGRRWLIAEGDHERAMACYRLARALFQTLGAGDNAAQCLADQGVAYSLVGYSTAALVAFEQARDEFAALITGQPAMATAAWQKAVLVADEVCQLYQVRQDADGLERSTARLGSLHAQPARGGPDLFGDAFPDTLQQQAALRTELAAVQVPLYRALAAREAGQHQQEIHYLELALAAARQTSVEHSGFFTANVLAVWRRYAEAEDAFRGYLEAGGSAEGFAGALAVRMAERFGPAGQAVAANQPEVTHRIAARFYANVNAFVRARGHLDALARVAGERWWQHDEQPWEAHQLLGEVAEGLGQLAAAQAAYARGIDALESRWQLQTRDEIRVAMAGQGGVRSLYFQAARATMRAIIEAGQQGDRVQTRRLGAQLLDIAERGKARALLDLLATGSDTASSEDSSRGRLRRLSAQLTIWRTLLQQERRMPVSDAARMAQLEQTLEQNEAELVQLEAELAARPSSLVQSQVIALADLQQRLPPKTALLTYYFQMDHLLAWAITAQGITATHLVELESKALNREIRHYHDACANPNEWQHLRIGESLSRKLLDPLRTVIDRHPNLLIVPHGAAHLLPFHALPWQDGPLGVTHTVAYLPNASALQFLTPGTPIRGAKILAVGNPAQMRYVPPLGGDAIVLAPLPAAEAEAHGVAALFPHKQVLTGVQATVDAVRAALPSAHVVHLATHGYLSEEAPLLSAVLLADGGALRVDEIMGLHLDAELVVLSACETGRGETTGGDDVLGLTRGLLAAGARAVVVSLWSVNDASTSLFMREFYHWLRQGETAAAALQAAQKYVRGLSPEAFDAALQTLAATLRASDVTADAAISLESGRHLRLTAGEPPAPRDYSHPFYWAPFIAIG